MPSCLGLWCWYTEKLFLALFCPTHFHFFLTYSLGNNSKMIQICLWQPRSNSSGFPTIGTCPTFRSQTHIKVQCFSRLEGEFHHVPEGLTHWFLLCVSGWSWGKGVGICNFPSFKFVFLCKLLLSPFKQSTYYPYARIKTCDVFSSQK